jgi:mono/diheme cytochrome c family protein
VQYLPWRSECHPIIVEGTMRKFALFIFMLPVSAHAQDVARGKAMAERWCANCHLVSNSATIGSANGLQTFPGLAADPKVTESRLRGAMTSQHGGRMPDFSLTKQEQDDLVAYVFSLRTK